MHAPAVALAGEIWKRHRWGLSAVGGMVLAFAIGIVKAPVSQNDAILYSICFVVGLCYVIGVFGYGFEARLESPESGFPTRLLLLPVRTSLLVGSPMVQGIIVAVALGVSWDYLVLGPGGLKTPVWWPVMLAAVVAACQAILWFPFGLSWVRLLVACAVLFVLVRAAALYNSFTLALGVSRAWAANPVHQNAILTVFAVALIPVSFLIARMGVIRSRRGESREWLQVWRPFRVAAERRAARQSFVSPLQAQIWYEWRLRGRGYAITVVLLMAALMCVALLLYHPGERADFGLMFLLIPPVVACFWGSQMGSMGESIRSTALTTFVASRPLGDAALVCAKLGNATLATGIAWGTVLATTATWFSITDRFHKLATFWEASVHKYGFDQAFGFSVLLAVGLLFGTWRALVANLWVGLLGRAWLVPAHIIFMMVVLFRSLFEWSLSSADAGWRVRFLAVLPWIIALAIGLKFLVAGLAFRASFRRKQMGIGTVVKLVSVWFLVALGFLALFAFFVPSSLVPLNRLAIVLVLGLPLARLAAAPLVLAWNRHC